VADLLVAIDRAKHGKCLADWFLPQLMLLEVKDGDKSPSRRELTPDQIEWHKRFPVTIVNSPEEAVLAVFGD
jgi:hypothetical protein